MKILSKLLLVIVLLSMGHCLAIRPELQGTPCDGKTIQQEHLSSKDRLWKATDTLTKNHNSLRPNWAESQQAIDDIRQSLAFLKSRYHPSNKMARPIPNLFLEQLQNEFRDYQLQSEPITSTEQGLETLKQALTGPNQDKALAMANIFGLYARPKYTEALIILTNEADARQSLACRAFLPKLNAKQVAEHQKLPARLNHIGQETIGMILLGGLFGFFMFRRTGRFGWVICIPGCWIIAYLVVFVLNTCFPAFNTGNNIIGYAVLVGLWLLWHKRFNPNGSRIGDGIFGSAAWAKIQEAQKRGRIQPKGFVLKDSHGFSLGRMPKVSTKEDARLRYMGHVLTCAPTGAGKGIGAVIPNLLEYPGSAFVLDVKGENYAVTHKQREAMGHQVFLIDPFGITGQPSHALNVLDSLNPTHPNVVSEAAMLTDMLVIPGGDDSYWDDAAKDLLRGLLIHVSGLPNEKRHLGEVRRLLTNGEQVLVETLETMQHSQDGFGVVARTAHAFLSKAEKDRSGVLSSAIRHTAFLDDPRIINACRHSDFKLEDLKTKRITVYIAMPPAKIAAYNRLMRCFVGMTLAAMTETTGQPDYKVAFFLDEFAQLGRMSAIEDAISVARGYGIAFWIFIQDLSQLKGVYPKWQTFLANAGAKQFFGTADFDTARYISNALGQATLSYTTQSHTVQDTQLLGSNTDSQHLAGRSLLTPDEVLRLGSQTPIVLISGESPYLLKRLNYLQDQEYSGFFDKNPYHS